MPCNRLLLSIYNNTHNNMITFHNNLTKAKIANELIMSVQSLNILHLSYSTVVSYFLACTFGQTLDATDFSSAVSGFDQSPEMKYFCHRR